MSASALADLVLVTHFLFVVFIVGGFALILAGLARGWAFARSPALRWIHFGAMAFVALEPLIGMACPLTVAEYSLRGLGADEPSFIARWVGRLLYWHLPEWMFTVGYVGFAAAVAYVLWRHPPRRWGHRKGLLSLDQKEDPA